MTQKRKKKKLYSDKPINNVFQLYRWLLCPWPNWDWNIRPLTQSDPEARTQKPDKVEMSAGYKEAELGSIGGCVKNGLHMRICCWIISTTDILASLRTRSFSKSEFPNILETWVAQWGHSVLWACDCLSYLSSWFKPLTTWLSGTIWGNHRPNPMWGKGLKDDFPLESCDSFKIRIQLLFTSWFGL